MGVVELVGMGVRNGRIGIEREVLQLAGESGFGRKRDMGSWCEWWKCTCHSSK